MGVFHIVIAFMRLHVCAHLDEKQRFLNRNNTGIINSHMMCSCKKQC